MVTRDGGQPGSPVRVGQGRAQKPGPHAGARGRPRGRRGQAPDSAARPPAPSAVSSILGTWLDQYSEDFCQPPDFPCLKQLVAYVQLNMPGSDLERRARLLLAQLEHTELTKAEPEGEEIGVGACEREGRGRCWTRRRPRGCLRPPTWGPLSGRTSWAGS